jgi:hypothetical protein
VAETDQEQLEYGNVTCVHGMNLGTSGGADFMCGECESGFTNGQVCLVCDETLWLQHGMWVLTCKPNKWRRDMALAIHDARRKKIANGTYEQTWRLMVLDILAREDDPKREHTYNKEANL